MAAPEPVDVEIDRERGLHVTFDDGSEIAFGLVELRAACPCADCRGRRERGEPAWPPPGRPAELSVVDAQLVGAWGLGITWSDGHATGIYAWDLLRALARDARDG